MWSDNFGCIPSGTFFCNLVRDGESLNITVKWSIKVRYLFLAGSSNMGLLYPWI